MTRWLAALGVLGALELGAVAQPTGPGGCVAPQLYQNGQFIGCPDIWDINAAGFLLQIINGRASFSLNPNTTQLGTCIAATGLCGTVDLTGKIVTLPSTIASMWVGSSPPSTPQARLHVQEPTVGREVFRAESVATADDPNYRLFQARATAAASSATTIDLNLTTAAPSLAPCPSGKVCLLEARTVCHCTSGTACTTDQGGANVSTAAIRNNAGTVAQIGSTATPVATIADAAVLTSIALTVAAPNARITVTVPANAALTCHVTYLIQTVGT